ncbi:hypothetical protein WS61_12515 [Burkholderia sp. ABCPW 11]|nr:hypothetical protein WS61_12515 [Burkholderia sp. ABCPW 11]
MYTLKSAQPAQNDRVIAVHRDSRHRMQLARDGRPSAAVARSSHRRAGPAAHRRGGCRRTLRALLPVFAHTLQF